MPNCKLVLRCEAQDGLDGSICFSINLLKLFRNASRTFLRLSATDFNLPPTPIASLIFPAMKTMSSSHCCNFTESFSSRALSWSLRRSINCRLYSPSAVQSDTLSTALNQGFGPRLSPQSIASFASKYSPHSDKHTPQTISIIERGVPGDRSN